MPLIGVDDMETPYWAQGYEKVVQASLREVAVAVPRTLESGGDFPERDLIVFVTAGVVIVTIVGQALVLPAVLRRAALPEDESVSEERRYAERTAIEEELEVLYDAYYEELEQYAHLQQDVGRFLPDANFGHVRSAPHPRPLMTTHPPPGPYDDEEEDEYSGEEDEEDYSNSEISSDIGYDSEERSLPPPDAADFLQFGSSLTVKGTWHFRRYMRVY